MRLRKFDSYAEYRDGQVAANRLKFRNIFAEERELRVVADHFRRRHPKARTGLCHGVRNGYEVELLRRLLPGVDVRGTDISDTVASRPHCIVWDMHDAKAEWRRAIDFVYSNSWDHSFDPARMFETWSECLTDDGRLYLPYTDLHSEGAGTSTSPSDVFGCSLDELIDVVRPRLVVDDLLEIRPHLTAKALRQKLSYLRMGRYRRILAPPTSRRIVVLVLRRRLPQNPAAGV